MITLIDACLQSSIHASNLRCRLSEPKSLSLDVCRIKYRFGICQNGDFFFVVYLLLLYGSVSLMQQYCGDMQNICYHHIFFVPKIV